MFFSIIFILYHFLYYIILSFVAEAAETEAMSASGGSPCFEYKLRKRLQSDKLSKEKIELEAKLNEKKKEVQKKQKEILELQDKVREFSRMESQVEEKIRKLEASNKERDILEKELIATRSQLAGIKRTLGI